MSNEKNKKTRQKPARQEWKPHWILRLLHAVWTAALSAAKIALGAVATVLMIVVVCGLVFVGILGDYLQNDILAESQDYEMTITDLDQTSFVYAVDSDGNIQLLQRIHTTVDREWASIDEIPYPVLAKITARITSEVEGINRVLYDITPKPTGTIEWE